MKFEMRNAKCEILIIGAGPAGASLAIRLAKKNFKVILIEREKFPRPKLCGEFISPECLRHFRDLDVLNEMFAVGGDRITETVFYEPNGKSVSVLSEWFDGDSQGALSVSRAEMDLRLLEKAKKTGVEVLEETRAVGILCEKGEVRGVKTRNKGGQTREIPAGLTIDATGRANVLGKLAEKSQIPNYKLQIETEKNELFGIWNLKSKINKYQGPKTKDRRPKLVGFKAHLECANLEKGRCEIYFFRGGYGGLSRVENGLANHCFLIEADIVKEFSGDADEIVERVIFQNSRARLTLKNAAPVHDWLAVSIDNFGARNLNPMPNLFTVGDAAASIDPFTGSGMLMALEGAEILAEVVAQNRFSPEKIAEDYKNRHDRKFQRRLRVCRWMRQAAFVPNLAKSLVSILSYSEKAREILARSTRQSLSMKENKS